MVITVEICQIVLDITNKKPKNIDIKTSKMTKKKKKKESKQSKPTNYRNNIKNVTIVFTLKEIIYHYSRGILSNNFNIAK